MDNLALDNSLLNSFKAFTGSHFMFNVVNAIQSDLLLDKNKDAFHTLQIFNRLYKYAVRCSNEQWTTLEDEIQFLNQYLAMEHIRFNSDMFPKSISCGPYDKEAIVPTFVFQSFLENAILLSLEQDKSDSLSIIITQNAEVITLQLNLSTPKDVTYHPKIEQKTKYAGERLNLLSELGLCKFDLTFEDESFMQLDINYLEM
jgi:two-component system, LytTR family, sensor histidine kinase AlgZ